MTGLDRQTHRFRQLIAGTDPRLEGADLDTVLRAFYDDGFLEVVIRQDGAFAFQVTDLGRAVAERLGIEPLEIDLGNPPEAPTRSRQAFHEGALPLLGVGLFPVSVDGDCAAGFPIGLFDPGTCSGVDVTALLSLPHDTVIATRSAWSCFPSNDPTDVRLDLRIDATGQALSFVGTAEQWVPLLHMAHVRGIVPAAVREGELTRAVAHARLLPLQASWAIPASLRRLPPELEGLQ